MNFNSNTKLHVAPARLEENVDGVVYVNEKCITCSACAMFAPDTFGYSSNHKKFIVKNQPKHGIPSLEETDDENNSNINKELSNARAAMSACPVGAIRAENSAQRNHIGKEKLSEEENKLAKSLVLNPKINGLSLPFPRNMPGLDNNSVYFLGYHNSRSFGAVPYLIKGNYNGITVMVDTPKFSPASVRAVTSLCGSNGPTYLFLTHVDDVADHEKWSKEFPNLKRIIHQYELDNNWPNDKELNNVEIILSGSINDDDEDKIMSWTLDGEQIPLDLVKDSTASSSVWPEIAESDFMILHTPGHSLGSSSLLYHSSPDGRNILFTGDTYAYSIRKQSMTGFPYYGNNLKLQSRTLRKLLRLPMQWDYIAPGHGSYKDYKSLNCDDQMVLEKREEDIEDAVEQMLSLRK